MIWGAVLTNLIKWIERMCFGEIVSANHCDAKHLKKRTIFVPAGHSGQMEFRVGKGSPVNC